MSENPRLKLIDAMIAWEPAHTGRPSSGKAAAVAHPDRAGAAEHLGATTGACSSDWREATPNERLVYLFGVFVTMTAKDGIAPLEAHRALLEIDEYRDIISRQMFPPPPETPEMRRAQLHVVKEASPIAPELAALEQELAGIVATYLRARLVLEDMDLAGRQKNEMRRIGESLYAAGGMNAMRDAFGRVEDRYEDQNYAFASSAIDSAWSGIGKWLN